MSSYVLGRTATDPTRAAADLEQVGDSTNLTDVLAILVEHCLVPSMDALDVFDRMADVAADSGDSEALSRVCRLRSHLTSGPTEWSVLA
jgi:hypothetical protein